MLKQSNFISCDTHFSNFTQTKTKQNKNDRNEIKETINDNASSSPKKDKTASSPSKESGNHNWWGTWINTAKSKVIIIPNVELTY